MLLSSSAEEKEELEDVLADLLQGDLGDRERGVHHQTSNQEGNVISKDILLRFVEVILKKNFFEPTQNPPARRVLGVLDSNSASNRAKPGPGFKIFRDEKVKKPSTSKKCPPSSSSGSQTASVDSSSVAMQTDVTMEDMDRLGESRLDTQSCSSLTSSPPLSPLSEEYKKRCSELTRKADELEMCNGDLRWKAAEAAVEAREAQERVEELEGTLEDVKSVLVDVDREREQLEEKNAALEAEKAAASSQQGGDKEEAVGSGDGHLEPDLDDQKTDRESEEGEEEEEATSTAEDDPGQDKEQASD